VHGNKSATIQPLRHELVAMILLDEVELLRGWIAGHFVRFDEEVSKQLYQAVFGAIVGHHVKMDQDWSKAAPCMNMGGCGTNIDVLVGHPDLKQIIGDNEVANKGFSQSTRKQQQLTWKPSHPFQQRIRKMAKVLAK